MQEFPFTDARGEPLLLQLVLAAARCNDRATEVCVRRCGSVGAVRWLLVTAVLTCVMAATHLHAAPPSLLCAAVILQLCLLGYRTRHRVVAEQLLLVSGLGAQVTTQYLSGRRSSLFVPWTRLADVIIAETVTMQRVLFYMAILVKKCDGSQPVCGPRPEDSKIVGSQFTSGDSEATRPFLDLKGSEFDLRPGTAMLEPLFMHTWPRLACLQVVYSNCQRVLRAHSH